MIRSCAAFGAVLLLVSSAGAADLPDARRLHSIDVFQLEYADDVQISPDGSRIVYVRVSHDIMTDRARRNLWIVNADGTNNRPLRSEAKNFSSPRWSPDGTRLAYVSAAEGSPQLYVRWMDSGQTALLTNLVKAPDAIAWSPDGKSIAFTQLVPPTSRRSPHRRRETRGRAVGAAGESHRLGGLPRRRRGLSRSRLPRTCSSSRPRAARRASSPRATSTTTDRCPSRRTANASCSRPIAARTGSATRRRATCSRSTSPRRKLTQLTTRDGPDNSPVVSPDGRKIAYLGFDDRLQGYQVTHLYVMDVDGENRREVTARFRSRRRGPEAGPPTAAASSSRMTNAACASLAARRSTARCARWREDLGGTDLGRPYTSGSFSVARNGRVAFPHELAVTSGRRGVPPTASARVARAHRAQRRPARQQDAGAGARAHLEDARTTSATSRAG